LDTSPSAIVVQCLEIEQQTLSYVLQGQGLTSNP
jgi:hypothetical protein